jgi:hypothetical protein
VARFRLRFLLQEFDLVGPETLIGRSPDCHITIEDPLVSREHARIRVLDSGEAVLVDLGSRNGLRVNGRPVPSRSEQRLIDGDRIRLGTQELVFTNVKAREAPVRPTGFMRMCSACNTPYPEGAAVCPHCGAATADDEDTMSGIAVEPRRSWTFHLLGEVIERALATRRATEAERLLRRASREIDERLAAGDKLDIANVTLIAGFAVRLAALASNSEWVAWALTLHSRQSLMVSASFLDALEQLDVEAFPELGQIVGGYCHWYRQHTSQPDAVSLASLARLEAFAARRT